MKVSREKLNKIIQEELETLINEESIDEEGFLKKAAGAVGGFFKGLKRGANTGSQASLPMPGQSAAADTAPPAQTDTSPATAQSEKPAAATSSGGKQVQFKRSDNTTSVGTLFTGKEAETAINNSAFTQEQKQTFLQQLKSIGGIVVFKGPDGNMAMKAVNPDNTTPVQSGQNPQANQTVAQASASPAAEKAKVLFINQAKEYMATMIKGPIQNAIKNTLRGPSLDINKTRLNKDRAARGLPPVKEAIQATTPNTQSTLMADAINKQVVALLSSLTTEEFAKIFADVAQTTLKDPKQLKQALKSFRLAENLSEIGEAPQSVEQDLQRGAAAKQNPTANTANTLKAGLNVSKSFTSMLAAAMKLKGVNPNQLVKKAFDSLPKERFALQPQQMNMAMRKAIEVLNNIMTNRAAKANDPLAGSPEVDDAKTKADAAAKAEAEAKAKADAAAKKQKTRVDRLARRAARRAARRVPVPASSTINENKEVNRWKKLAGLIKG